MSMWLLCYMKHRVHFEAVLCMELMKPQEDAAALWVCSESCSTGGGSTPGCYATTRSALISVLPGKITNLTAPLCFISICLIRWSSSVSQISSNRRWGIDQSYKAARIQCKKTSNLKILVLYSLFILCKLNSNYLQITVEVSVIWSVQMFYKQLQK